MTLATHLDGSLLQTIHKDIMSTLVAHFHTLRRMDEPLVNDKDGCMFATFDVPFAFPEIELFDEELNETTYADINLLWSVSQGAILFNRYVEYVFTKAWEDQTSPSFLNDIKLFTATSVLTFNPKKAVTESNRDYSYLSGFVHVTVNITSLSNFDTPFAPYHTKLQTHISEFIIHSIVNPKQIDTTVE